MSNTDLFQLVLCLLGLAATGLGAMAIWILQDLLTSVKSLNEKMATICARVDGHEHRIDRLENHKET